jgi:hypothetical protein
MKATAQFESPRSSGIPLIFMGVLILGGVLPFAVFVALNMDSGLVLFVSATFPGLLGLATLTVGVLQCTGRIKLRPPRMVIETGGPEQRLAELDRLKQGNLITPEEYATKRQEILKDL